MGKELAKKAGLGAVETTLKALMPELFERLDKLESRLDDRFEAMESRIEKRFEKVDDRFEKMTLEMRDLRNEMLEKFESTRDLINEVAQRIHAVGAMAEVYKRESDKLESRLDNLIERTGFLQGTMSQKRRKAG